MAGSVNKVILVGTLGKYGVQVRFAPNGTPCAAFTLVLTEQSQHGKYYSTLVECEVWGKRAETASELAPGQLCAFEGKVVKRKKGEQWECVISGFELTALGAAVEVPA